MKINVVKDTKGKVIATFENGADGVPSVTPVLEPGYKVEELEVKENYKADIKGFYAKHG